MDDHSGPIAGFIFGVFLTSVIAIIVTAKVERTAFSQIYHKTHVLQRYQDRPDGAYYYKLVPKDQVNESYSIQN